jgi:PA domain-containing protein
VSLIGQVAARRDQIGAWQADKKLERTRNVRIFNNRLMKAAICLFFGSCLAPFSEAQTGALPVNIQGVIYDQNEPPADPVKVSDTFDPAAGLGPRIMISPSWSDAGFNLSLFTNDPHSRVFSTFRLPGTSFSFAGQKLPADAALLGGWVGKNFVTVQLAVFSGTIGVVGSDGPSGILYAGSDDNPFILDTYGDMSPDLTAPVYSWDYVDDGIVGDGDNLACAPASGPNPAPGFIVLIARGSCSFSEKLYNAAWAGARAAIIYTRPSDGNDQPQMYTPGASIPGMLVRNADGMALVKLADYNSRSPLVINAHATNILGTVTGSFTMGADGILTGVDLSLFLADQIDRIFFGTVKAP